MSFLEEHPKRLAGKHDRGRLQEAMKLISSLDLLKSEQSGNCVLFLEGQSDFEILRAWAQVLEHRLYRWLNQKAYWHDMKGKEHKKAREHFNALRAFRPKMKGFILLDSDNKKEIKFSSSSNIKLKQWKRYETESYLVHPDPIKRLIKQEKGDLFGPYLDKAEKKLRGITPGEYLEDPLNDQSNFLKLIKGSDDILDKVFLAAKFHIGKGDYYRLAAVMNKEEIHDDVPDMLDAIADHFGIEKSKAKTST